VTTDLIINLAPTGAVHTRDHSPHVPLQPREIIADVNSCVDAGASMVHLHAREADGTPSYRKELYAEIIDGIREHNENVVIVVSTSGRTFADVDKRTDVLRLRGDSKPDMASLTLGSLNFMNTASVNSPDTIMRILDCMTSSGIRPEIEVFDLGMVNVAHSLIRRGMLEPPYFFNVILGNIATAQAKLSHLALIASELPEGSYWSLAGIGRFQRSMCAAGVVFAHGVRVGLEDAVWNDKGKTSPATNAALVRQAAGLAHLVGRGVARPDAVRRMLQLGPAAGSGEPPGHNV
jgi:3-keto-5-aminohexanoate cleavage enzyme